MLFVLNILYPLLIIIVNKELSNLLQDIHNWVYSQVKEHFVHYYVNFYLKSLQAVCKAIHVNLLAHFLVTTCKPWTLVNSLQTSSSQFANYLCKLGLLALWMSSCFERLDTVKKVLSGRFRIKDMGPLHWCSSRWRWYLDTPESVYLSMMCARLMDAKPVSVCQRIQMWN